MEFTISGAGPDDEHELLSPHRRLGQDPKLVRAASVRLVEADAPAGAMGSVLEAVHVVVNDAAAVAGLATSVGFFSGFSGCDRTRTERQHGQVHNCPLPLAGYR